MGYYAQPAQANFINTYVPIPFDEIVAAGKARQERQDVGEQGMENYYNQISTMAAIPDSEHEKALAEYLQNANDIINKYAQTDLSQKENAYALKNELKARIDLGHLSKIARSRTKWEESQKLRTELGARGLLYEPYEKVTDPYLKGTLGKYDEYTYSPTPFQDPEKTAGALFADLKPRKTVYTDPKTGMIKEIAVLDSKDIDERIQSTIRTFSDTPQGQWVLSQYYANNPGSNKKPDEVMSQYMHDIGKRFQQYSEDYAGFDPFSKAAATAAAKQQIDLGGVGSIFMPSEGTKAEKALYNFKANKQQIAKLKSDLAGQKLAWKSAKTQEEKDAIASTIEDLTSKVAYYDNVKQDIMDRAGITVPDYNKFKSDYVNANADKFKGYSSEDVDNLFTIADNAKARFESGTFKRPTMGEEIVSHIKEKVYFGAATAEVYTPAIRESIKDVYGDRLSRKELNKKISEVYDIVSRQESMEPSNLQQSRAFKEFGNKETHSVTRVPYVTGTKNGFPILPNGAQAAGETLINGIRTNPENFTVRSYNNSKGIWEELDKDELQKIKKSVPKGGRMIVSDFPELPNQKGEYEIGIKVVDADGNPSDAQYRMILDPGQGEFGHKAAFARDYEMMSMTPRTGRVDDSYMRAYQLRNPDIASQYMTQYNKATREVNLSSDPSVPPAIVTNNADGSHNVEFGGQTWDNIPSDEHTVLVLYGIALNIDPAEKTNLQYIQDNISPYSQVQE